MSSSLLCVFERIKYDLSVKSTQENRRKEKLLMKKTYLNAKKNVTYIMDYLKTLMDYIEREFGVGLRYQPRCSRWTGSSASRHITSGILNPFDARENSDG